MCKPTRPSCIRKFQQKSIGVRFAKFFLTQRHLFLSVGFLEVNCHCRESKIFGHFFFLKIPEKDQKSPKSKMSMSLNLHTLKGRHTHTRADCLCVLAWGVYYVTKINSESLQTKHSPRQLKISPGKYPLVCFCYLC